MIIFGLTGSIAVGKSTVTRTFRAHHIPMVDADIVARQVVEPFLPAWENILSTFGKDYFYSDNTLNRNKLGDLVFSDQQAMIKLNDIMGSAIQNESQKQIHLLQENGHSLIGYDGALIIEMGNANKYRPLIVISCPREIQLQRLMKRNSLTKEQAEARINAQMSTEEKIKYADYIIDSSYTIEYSIEQTEKIIQSLFKMNQNYET